MKINLQSLFQVARFQAFKVEYEQGDYNDDYDDYDTITKETPCSVAIVTSDNLEAAAALRAATPDDPKWANELDAEIGDVVVISFDGDGRKVQKIPLSSAADLHIKMETHNGETYVPFGGNNMSGLRESLRTKAITDPLTAPETKLNADLLSIMRHIAAAPDGDMTVESLRDAYVGMINETFGDAQFDVTPAEIAKKMRTDVIRSEIAKLNPDHPDAFGVSRSVDELLRRNFMTVFMGTGAEMRSGMYSGDQMRASVASNDTLSRKVFGAMTCTRIENLGAAMVSGSKADMLLQRLANRKMEGAWIEKSREAIAAVFSQMMPGYRFEMDMINHEGNDILVVRDNIGAKNQGFSDTGSAYIYSWPEIDRRPTMQIGDGLMATITAADIPSDEEVSRLEAVLSEVQGLDARNVENILMADDDLGDDFDDGNDPLGDFLNGPRPDRLN
jgi:hypothetical protein